MQNLIARFLFALALSSIFFYSNISLAVSPDNPLKTIKAPGIQEIVLESAKKSFVVRANPCKTATFSPLDDFAIFTPLKYARGMIAKGMWRQSVLWKGCGRERTLNVLLFADADKNILQTVAAVPGSTRADPVLQKNIPASAQQLIKSTKKIPGCQSIYVDNTKFLQETKNPNRSVTKPMWEELWTFDACNKKVQTIVTFVPGLRGIPYTMTLKEDGEISAH